MDANEGVIKFRVEHRHGPLDAGSGALAARLIGWCAVLWRVGLVGQDLTRYGGAGFGNVSARVGQLAPPGARAFVISGTQTGGKPTLSLDDFCLVQRYDAHDNAVVSEGPVLPSSESLTHGAIYDLRPDIGFVLHGHAPLLWRRARELGLPLTAAEVPYGTPAMAAEVARLFADSDLPARRVLAMGGHEDGVIAFGAALDEAGAALMAALARAHEPG